MKKIIFLFMLILLSSFVSAIDYGDADLLAWLRVDDASGSLTDSSTGTTNYGFSNRSGSGSSCAGSYQYNKIPDYSTHSYNFQGCTGNNYAFVNDSINNAMGGTKGCNWTISFWYNGTEDGDGTRFISTRESDDTTGFMIFMNGGTLSFLLRKIGSFVSLDYAIGSPFNAMITVATNNTAMYLYVNNTLQASNNDVNCDERATSVENMTIGNAGIYAVPGQMDEIIILNRSISQTEVNDLYANGISAVAPEVPEAPTITAPSPADDSNNNKNVTLNVSHSTPSNDVRYYLYFGTASTLDEGDLIYNNVTRNASEYSSWITNVGDGTYYWKHRVQNITDGLFSANTTQRTLTIDTVNPTITIYQNTSFRTDNSTIISNYFNGFNFNVSFFDTYLYQTLINITNETGNSVFSILNTSVGGKTTANYSRNIDISGWTIGDYTIKLVATDSHTTNEIEEYDIRTGFSYFRYTTEEGNVITIKSDTLPLTKDTTKLDDRYDFEFTYLFQEDTYTFIIESYNKIDYIEDSEYNAHFVIIGNNGGNWLDFENPNLNSKDYKITKIDDYTYEVEITANDMKSFTFNSLGGLNKVEKHYLLKIGAVIDIWSFDDDTDKAINATATIGSQSAHTIANIQAAQLVNITKDITGVTMNSTDYGIEGHTVSITSNFHNFTLNMTQINAAKLYFYDEKSETLISGETFSVYLETTGFSQTYSGFYVYITDNPYSITSLDSGLYKLKASSGNYPEREYKNLNISNTTTTNLNIYLINSTSGSEKTFSVTDEGINPLEDVDVVFTRTINGTDTIIAEENTDYAGQCKLYLDNDYEYTINFSKVNYEDKTIELEPTDSTYSITLKSLTEEIINRSLGINYRFSPLDIVLNNNTNYNFTFNLNSSYWTLTNCTLRLYNDTILINETSSFTPNSCYIRIERGTSDMTTIVSEAIYELDSAYTTTVSKNYEVIYTYEGQFSLKNFLDDLTNFGMAGFDSFGRIMLALIVIFVITALAARSLGFTNPESLIPLIWALVGFFSYINWFYLDYSSIPDITGLRKWIIFILVSLVSLGFFIDKFGR